MLAAIVRSSLAHPRIVTAASVLIAVLGAAALVGARFDVFPDFAPPHVLVQTETPGLDATSDVVLVSDFADQAALDAYQVHPVHQEVKKFVVAVAESRQCVDYLSDSAR